MSKLQHAAAWVILLLGTVLSAGAQEVSVAGRVRESSGQLFPVTGATVRLQGITDTAFRTGAVTDLDGAFRLTGIPGSAVYRLSVSYLGMQPYEKDITTGAADVTLADIALLEDSRVLENVLVRGQQIRVQQLNDTTQFNAGAFKTNPDATAEDLLLKMPGIISEGGTLKVQGEQVRQVLVDGKPFFGDDPDAAIKNLPAEIIDKIQVFDRMSDQAQFTGFDDGESLKTINIVTKSGLKTGQFGRLYAGGGADNRYQAGGNLNSFKGDRRISVIGLSNNTNQQNFSSDDLMGVMSGSGSGGGRQGRGGGGRGMRGGGPGGQDAANFLTSSQNGITATNAIGLNYSDTWGKKIKVSGSYFFNTTSNERDTRLDREYFTAADSGMNYAESNASRNRNTNHRINARFEYNIDSASSLIVTPALSLQRNRQHAELSGSSSTPVEAILSSLLNKNESGNTGLSFNNNILFRHRFRRAGRTLSASLGTSLNGRNGSGEMYSLNTFTDADTTLLDQEYTLHSDGYRLNGNITFTEPVSRYAQVMFTYMPSLSRSSSSRETFSQDPLLHTYTLKDTLLSNEYDNTYTTQQGGLSYRFQKQKIQFTAGANFQHAHLEGVQHFPGSFTVRKDFRDILPQATFSFRPGRGENLRFMYRTSTNAPSISQLQQVTDISNPLLMRTGNTDLKQEYRHTGTLRYNKTNAETARSMFVFLSSAYSNNYIGYQTIIPASDSTLADGTLLRRGSQLSRPVNLDGYWNARSFLTYGMPVALLKSNFNINAGISYGRTPSLTNQLLNYSHTYGPSAGMVLSSNISPGLDFTVAYNGNYNIVKNTLRRETDNSYYSHLASFRINWVMHERWVLNTDITHNIYSGLSRGFNQQYLLWNAYAGYKFLKDRSLEARVSGYDLLNQNRSISREITDTYLEDTYTGVLNRYFMVSLIYTIRSFSSGS